MRRTARERSDGIEVELVEEVLDEPGHGEPTDRGVSDRSEPGPDRHRPRHRWSRRARVGAGVALGALVLASWALTLVGDARQEAAREQALALSPGVLDPIDGPLVEAWRLAGGVPISEAAGVMVLSVRSPDGTGTVQGVDPSTGTVIWQYPAAGARPGFPVCGPIEQEGPPVGGAADLLACTDVTRYRVPEPDVPVRPATLYVLDVRTGTEVMVVHEDAPLLAWATVHGDIAVAIALPDGRVEARRYSVPGAQVVWTYRSVEPLVAAGHAQVWGMWVDGDRFVLPGEPGLSLDLATGEAVPGPDDAAVMDWPGQLVRVSLPGGGTAEWTVAMNGSGSGRVLDDDGTERFTLDGAVAAIISDGSAPDRIVVEHGRVNTFTVIDARTGEVAWEGRTGQRPVARLGGLLVVTEPDAVRGLRLRDGLEQWALPATGAGEQPVLTDGRVLLVRRDAGSLRILSAVDATDGEELWQMRMPQDVSFVYGTAAGTVVGYTDDGVVVYR